MIAAPAGVSFGRHLRPRDHSPRHPLTPGIRHRPDPHRQLRRSISSRRPPGWAAASRRALPVGRAHPHPSALSGCGRHQPEFNQYGAGAEAAELARCGAPSALPFQVALLPRFDDRAPLLALLGGLPPTDRAGVPFCHVSLTPTAMHHQLCIAMQLGSPGPSRHPRFGNPTMHAEV